MSLVRQRLEVRSDVFLEVIPGLEELGVVAHESERFEHLQEEHLIFEADGSPLEEEHVLQLQDLPLLDRIAVGLAHGLLLAGLLET